MNEYLKGNLIRCRAAIDPATDPTTLTFRVKDPSGDVTTYIYGTDAQLVRDSQGNYHVDVDANEVGVWLYGYKATGTGQATEETLFEILPSGLGF